MRRKIVERALAIAGGVIAAATPAAARQETQFWVTQGAAVRVGPDTAVGFDASERFYASSVARHQFLARFSFGQRIVKGVELGGGIAWSRNGHADEYRPHAEATIFNSMFALRTRIEARMFEGADRTVWRLRERAQMSLPLDADKNWTLVANGEVLFNLNSANVSKQVGLMQLRSLVGVRRALSDRLSLNLAYQRQQTLVRGGPDTITHQPIIGLAARF